MNLHAPALDTDEDDFAPGEFVLVAGRQTDPLGNSLRRVFEIDEADDDVFASLLRRLC